MPRNMNRTLVDSREYDFVQVDRYSSGAVYFRWLERRNILILTNAEELATSGYIEKLAKLLVQEEASDIIASYPRGLTLDYTPNRHREGFKYILDSGLDVDSKLIYLISLVKTGFALGEYELEMIFEKRPSPRQEWQAYSSPFNISKEGLIRGAVTPGYFLPEDYKDKTVNGFKRLCLTSAFVSSERSVTHAEFIATHDEDYFIPHLLVNGSPQLFDNVPKAILADLLPAEYTRFMSYFVQRFPHELLPWAKERFRAGVVNFREAKSKGSARLQPGNVANWLPMIHLLTVEEAHSFQELLREHNGVGSLANGVDAKLAPLLAYYFTEGGKSKFNELVAHIIEHGPGLQQDFYRGTVLKLNWSNPYRPSNGGKPSLVPYVQALKGEMKDYPLEWSLASL